MSYVSRNFTDMLLCVASRQQGLGHMASQIHTYCNECRSGRLNLKILGRGHNLHSKGLFYSKGISNAGPSRYKNRAPYHAIKVLDARSGECLSTPEGHSKSIYLMTFSHDSTRLASASWDCKIKVWDARSGDCLSVVNVDKILNRISFDSNGKYLPTKVDVINLSARSTIFPASTNVDTQNAQYYAQRHSLSGHICRCSKPRFATSSHWWNRASSHRAGTFIATHRLCWKL